MNKSTEMQIFLFFLFISLFIIAPISAQTKINTLIISEVYVDIDEPLKNWFEVYNPTDETLVLERLRISHIRTINILPFVVRKSGGEFIRPNEYFIVCANKALFEKYWKTSARIMVIDQIANVIEGGFIIITTKDEGEANSDGFRYGKPSISSHLSKFLGDQVLSFSKDGKSYSRRISKTTGQSMSSFYKTFPTPGQPNN